MSDHTKLLLFLAITIAVAGSVRMRYMQAKETGVTRSSIPLRTKRDMLARLQLRLTWFWLPTLAISLWLWFYRDPVTAVLTQAFAVAFVMGSVVFDHMLLKAWAKNPPPGVAASTAERNAGPEAGGSDKV